MGREERPLGAREEFDAPILRCGFFYAPDAELSFLHVDDVARAFVTALDAPKPSRIPGWLARFFVGKVSAETFTRPMPTSNAKFRREVGWEPEYPTYREGFARLSRPGARMGPSGSCAASRRATRSRPEPGKGSRDAS